MGIYYINAGITQENSTYHCGVSNEHRKAKTIYHQFFILLYHCSDHLCHIKIRYFSDLSFYIRFFSGLHAEKAHRLFIKKLHLKRPFAAIILVVIFYAIIVTIFSVISVKLFVAAKDFVFRLPQIYSKDIQPVISNIFDDIEEYASRIDPSLIASLEEVSSGFMQSPIYL